MYNTDGDKVFDSRNKYPKIVDIVTYGSTINVEDVSNNYYMINDTDTRYNITVQNDVTTFKMWAKGMRKLDNTTIESVEFLVYTYTTTISGAGSGNLDGSHIGSPDDILEFSIGV